MAHIYIPIIYSYPYNIAMYEYVNWIQRRYYIVYTTEQYGTVVVPSTFW